MAYKEDPEEDILGLDHLTVVPTNLDEVEEFLGYD